jgi:thiol-disulfide isomerase/thioredoxin
MNDIKGVVLKNNDFTSNLNGVYVNQNKINKNPGMLLIHADWCGHCVRFKPTFNELCNSIGNDFTCTSIESVEITDDLKNKLSFRGFPTIKFFDQSGRIIGDYNGSREKGDILEHICNVYHHCYYNH